MGRNVVLLVVLSLALPLAAFASSSIDIGNAGGVITGNSSGLSLTSSTLINVGGIVGSHLGSVTFTTGAFTSGDSTMGGTLEAGGAFQILGNGTNGVANGVIFNATFSSGTWELMTLANGTHNYMLSGGVVNASGQVAATTQLTLNTGKGFFNGNAGLSGGNTNLAIPEPGTLALLGTGLVGLAAIIRRKLSLI